jgi:hypothetical protein
MEGQADSFRATSAAAVATERSETLSMVAAAAWLIGAEQSGKFAALASRPPTTMFAIREATQARWLSSRCRRLVLAEIGHSQIQNRPLFPELI